jgi:pyruvate/2-oxoacid:ferredoxin oxidoreductase beta subunit
MGLIPVAKQDTSYEGMYSGHPACQGCGAALGLRFLAQSLRNNAILIVVAGCSTTIAGVHPTSAFKVPVLQTAFATGGAAASGLRAALRHKKRDDIQVVVWAGDGGTFDIGLQSLSGAVERNHSFLFICCDNEAYMNTGVQSSGATPYGAWTTTTPGRNSKNRFKKDIMGIMAAHRIPYAATATIAYPKDMQEKIEKALSIPGARFLHLLAPCPSGWRYDADLTIHLSRLAVQSNVFPLYEIENGSRYSITELPKRVRDVSEYLSFQGRFSSLSEYDLEEIREEVKIRWESLCKKANLTLS